MTNEEIIAIRENLGLSRKKFAHLINVPYETLCRWENGKRSPSKYYENRLRQLTGKTQVLKLEETWIFLDYNLRNVKTVISRTKGSILGTLHAVFDQNKRIFLVTIRLQANTHTLNDLDIEPWVGQGYSQNGQQRQIVGLFIATDRQTRPGHHILSFMRTVLNECPCAIYSRAKDEFLLWKLCSSEPYDVENDLLCSIPYVILG